MKKFFAQAYLWFLLAMLYAPILIIAIFSFTEAKVLGNWTGFSTKLYTSLFQSGAHHSLVSAIENTLIIALISAGVSTLLGSIAAIGIDRLRGHKRAVLNTLNNIKLFGTTIQENINNGMWNYGAALSLIMLVIIFATDLFSDSDEDRASNEGGII